MSSIDTGIIYAYLAMMILIGFYASTRQKTVEDYYVAGRRLGPFTIACLWLASWVGGASIIGATTRAYEIGITSIWYVLSLAMGCLLFGLFFAARIKKIGDKHGFMTYPDLIEHHFDSRTRIIATITTMLAYVAYAAGQLVAAAAILQILLGWEYESALILASAIVIIYTATGGFLAVTYTDWVQFILLLVGIVIIGMPIAIREAGTWSDLVAALPAGHFELGAWGWANIVALALSIVLSFFVSMDSFTRCYAARDHQAARKGALLAVIFMLPIAVASTWLGLSAAVLFPGIENTNGVLTTFVMELFPVGLKGLVLVGILAAVMSSADILLLIVSANLTQDLYQRFVNPAVSMKKMKTMGVAASFLTGVVATLLAWKMQDIIAILLLGFTLNSAALILPTILALYFRKFDSSAAFWSICLSLITVIAWYVAQRSGLTGIFEIQALWPGLMVSFLAFGLFSISRRKHDGH